MSDPSRQPRIVPFENKSQRLSKSQAAIREALQTATSIFEETILEQPLVFQPGTRFTIAELRDDMLHRYDRDRLRTQHGTIDGVGKALAAALERSPYARRLTDDGVGSTYEIVRLPKQSLTHQELLGEVMSLRQASRNQKELGLMVVDLMGATGSLRATCEEQERIVQRLAMLALHYREKLLTARRNALLARNPPLATDPEELRKETLKGVDPHETLLEEMLLDPDQHVRLMGIETLHGLLTDFAGTGKEHGEPGR